MSPEQRAAWLKRWFLNRTDVVAFDPRWEKSRVSACPTDALEPAQLDALLLTHLAGEAAPPATFAWKTVSGGGAAAGRFRVGSYAPAPDGTTRWACLDFDGSGHKHPLRDPLGTALKALDTCAALGVPAYLERSGGGQGYHVWLFFDPPAPAARVRAFALAVAPRDAELAAGGPPDIQRGRGIEVFPKQDQLRSPESKGNLVWLPCWSGAAPGGNAFYRRTPTGELEPYEPEIEPVPMDAVERVLASLPQQGKPSPKGKRRASTEFGEAVARYNAEHPRDYPRSSSACPACGSPDGFKAMAIAGRWACFSSRHQAVGLQGNGCWHGDALDLAAHEAGCSREDLLRGEGYLAGSATSAPSAREAAEPRKPSPYPAILANHQQLRTKVAAAWEAVHRFNAQGEQPRIFWRSNVLARLTPTGTGGVAIDLMKKPAIVGLLTRAADWFEEGKDGVQHPSDPDGATALDMQSSPDRTLPWLEAVVDCPVIGRSGELIDRPGYHPSDRLWLELPTGAAMPPVPRSPTSAEIETAKQMLLVELLGDFGFATQHADRANAVAALLCPLVRRLIPAVTPLHLFSAPKPGSGKGLLADLVSIIATGSTCEASTFPRDGDELRKRILGWLLQGQSIILLDNLVERERINSPELASVLTAERFQDRVLGFSQVASSSTLGITWLASGNDPRPSEELARRIVRVHLDLGVDKPELYVPPAGWRHPKLREWARAHRFELVNALLVLAQAWLAAGRPEYSGVKPASYETWAEVVGGILQHAGIEGFLGNFEYWLRATDPAGDEASAFLEAWWTRFQGGSVRGQQLVDLMLEQKLLPTLVRGSSAEARRSSLGKLVRGWDGRAISGFVVNGRWDSNAKVWIWSLRQLAGAPRNHPQGGDHALLAAATHEIWGTS